MKKKEKIYIPMTANHWLTLGMSLAFVLLTASMMTIIGYKVFLVLGAINIFITVCVLIHLDNKELKIQEFMKDFYG